MGIVCIYCGKSEEKDGVSLHKFPNNSKLLTVWIKNMGLNEDVKVLVNNKLCSDHFDENCFTKNNNERRRLLSESVPTKFTKYYLQCVCCKNVKKIGCNLSFRKFPFKNLELLKKWVDNIGEDNFCLNERSLICDEHFNTHCFYKGKSGSCTLKATAYPTIFTNILKDSVSCNEDSTSISMQLDSEINTAAVCEKRPCIENLLNPKRLKSDLQPLQVSTAESPKSYGRLMTSQNSKVNHDHHYQSTPKGMQKRCSRIRQRLQNSMKESYAQKQHIKRLQKKISTLEDIVRELRRNRAVSESGLVCLDNIAQSDVSQLMKRFLKNHNSIKRQVPIAKRLFKSQRSKNVDNICRDKYPPALRSFACTLHFYSPKAYAFVRRKFCKALPHPRTLKDWYSAVNGEPGFTFESFDALRVKVLEASENDKEVLVSLMIDAIHIKKGLQYLPNGKVRGYVDIGTEIDDSDTMQLATQAVVLMVVSMDSSWKLPIGYVLVNGMEGEATASIISQALVLLNDINVKVLSVTLDGPADHFSAMRSLGATFDMPNPQPFFPHPSTNEKIFVIFDPCHMLKLFRNCLGQLKFLKDNEGNLIEWRFIENLVNLQELEGLRAGNKLRRAHIDYTKMKMKVNLAAQTLSTSTANSIEYCDNYLHLKEFRGSSGTVRFILCIDRIFDFLNSRNPFGKGFKSPLRKTNEVFWRQNILKEVEYLKGITNVTGQSIFKSKRYVPFVGFITAVISVINIFDLYVKPEGSQLQYLLTYKLSQDHLELFFSAIRQCGGWCTSPTCTQFLTAYKRLLVRHEVAATNGNVEAMDSTSILTVPSVRPRGKRIDYYDTSLYEEMANLRVEKKYGLAEVEYHVEGNDFLQEFSIISVALPDPLSSFSKGCVSYIAGWVVKKILNDQKSSLRVQCLQCREALLQPHQKKANLYEHFLIEAKSHGGLIYPSESVTLICQRSEQFFRYSLRQINNMIPREDNFPAVLCSKILYDIIQSESNLFPTLRDHLFDDAPEECNHVYTLSKKICQTYIKLRMFSATKSISEEKIGTKIRNHLNRQIIWQHQ